MKQERVRYVDYKARNLNIVKGIIFLLLFPLILNLPFIGLREFQGEEGRRVMIAVNMLESGNYVIPSVEGAVYLQKPPLFNWLLAGMFRLTRSVSETSARLVSVIAAFLSALILSLFWRRISGVKDVWFILPGVMFLTFTDVMDKSIRAEIDMTFTFFVTCSIISWYYLHEFRKTPLPAWVVSLFLVGIAALTKGVQAPAFFYCGVIPYLVYKKEFRRILSASHFIGILVCLGVFSLWLILLLREVDFTALINAWRKEILARGEPLKEGGFLRHFAEFPFQYVVAYMPWLPFVLLWFKDSWKKESDGMKDLAMYCLFFLLFSLPFYWILPGARLRYVMPVSGALAILLAIPVSAQLTGSRKGTAFLRGYTKILSLLMIFTVTSSPFWGKKFGVFEKAVPIVLLCAALFVSLLLYFEKRDVRKKMALLIISVLIMKISWASVYFPYHAEHLSHYRKAALQINELVPRDAALYDYEVNNYHLAFYLGRPVKLIRSLDEVINKKGAVVMIEKDSMGNLDLKGFSFIGEVKARRSLLELYEVGKNHKGETS
jgi:4-amino-4-deoxy-L-arabinose transferase-like glycosyltransferase